MFRSSFFKRIAIIFLLFFFRVAWHLCSMKDEENVFTNVNGIVCVYFMMENFPDWPYASFSRTRATFRIYCVGAALIPSKAEESLNGWVTLLHERSLFICELPSEHRWLLLGIRYSCILNEFNDPMVTLPLQTYSLPFLFFGFMSYKSSLRESDGMSCKIIFTAQVLQPCHSADQ